MKKIIILISFLFINNSVFATAGSDVDGGQMGQSPYYVLAGRFLDHAPVMRHKYLADAEKSFWDVFEISATDRLDMNWRAILDVHGTQMEPAMEIFLTPNILSFEIPNLEIKYKLLRYTL